MGDFNWRRFLTASMVVWLWLCQCSLAPADETAKIVPPVRHDPGFSSVDRSQLVVALMGDPQLYMNPDSLDHAKTAMADLAAVPHDFLVVLGDLVQNKPEYFVDYERLILRQATKPVYSIAGNAEIGAGLDAYQKCTGLPLHYVIYRRGIRFIFTSVTAVTGPKTHICNLGDEQLAWLRDELASDTRSTTIIAFHAPVFETTWHSEDRESTPFPGSMYLKESAEMRALFAQYPNIKLYIHGHLHHSYGVRDDFGRGEYCLDDGVLHISVGATANNLGSSVLFIGSDKIVAKVRDHKNRRWRDKVEFTFDVKTTYSTEAKSLAPDKEAVYKTVGKKELKLHIFTPANHKPSDKSPAIVFFFGGGWNGGSPSQFYPHCKYLASRGMVAMSADYRVKSRDKTSPRECVMDGKSAIRWIRQHANELGINPDKVAAGGGSAGGHVAAATGTTQGINEEGENQSVSCIPNALVLFNPVYDNGPSGYGHDRVKEYWREFSPLHNINQNTPPTVVFLGTKDKLIPVATGQEYKRLMEAKGRRCDLHLYKDQPHGFFNFGKKDNYTKTVIQMDRFLTSLGYLAGFRSGPIIPQP